MTDMAIKLAGASLIMIETKWKTVHKIIAIEDKTIEKTLAKIVL